MNKAKGEDTLGSLCERITVGHVGPMANSYSSSGIPFLRSQDIGEFRISTSNIKFIPPEFDQKLKKSRLKAGDVAIVRTGYPGTAAVVPQDLDGANCADLVILTPGPALDAWFVACLLNSAWGRGHVSGVLVGVAQQHFNVGAARDLKTVFPPLHIQRRIGSIIRAYCDLIEVNRRRIAILEDMARRLFDEWFVRFRYPGHDGVPLVETELGAAPEGWTPVRLGSLLTLNYGKALKADQRRAGTVPVFGSSGIVGEHDQNLVRGPGVIVGRKGNVGAVHWSTHDFYPIDTVFYVETNIPLRWVYQLLERQTFLNSDAAVPGLNREQAYAVKVLRPAPEHIGRYSELVEPLFHQAELLAVQNGKLRAARDLLLPKLISGEIDVSAAEEIFAEAAE